MAERYRSGVRGVEENPRPYAGGLFALAVALTLGSVGVAERNLAMIGAGALIYGGYEGARWFLNKRRERQASAEVEKELQELRYQEMLRH